MSTLAFVSEVCFYGANYNDVTLNWLKTFLVS